MPRQVTHEQFLSKAISVHNTQYSYDKSRYVRAKAHIIITCKVHGDFQCTPDNHIRQQSGCPQCAGRVQSTSSEFTKKAQCVHGEKYSYDNVAYIINKQLSIVISTVLMS